MDRRFWVPVAERLAGNAAVLVYDCRGHGASEKSKGPYTVEGFANDLADLLDHVQWPRAAVAGASMGGCVTLAFGAAYPQRTAALGLIDTTAWYGPTAPADWAERARKAAEGGMRALVQFQTTRWFAEAFRERNPAVVRQCVDIFCANDLPAYLETCRMLGAADLRTALPAFRMPTAVVVGEEDYATPVAMAKALHEAIAGSTLTVLPRARHLTPLEQPDAIASTLSALLDRT
jgi:3-oxoadipate enol-lactonase